MKLKSLLLGSAAALVAFSGARAADAVIAEPEPVEYVRVCDAYGAGYFYLPGTETCLKIGGFVRYEINYSNVAVALPNKKTWDKTTQANITFSAKSDTDYGMLEGFLEMTGKQTNAGVNGTPSSSGFGIDSAYIALGGLKMGYFSSAFDGGIGGENDGLGGTTSNTIQYTFASGGFDATVGLNEDTGTILGIPTEGNYMPNVSANAGFSAGAVAIRAFVNYDDAESVAQKNAFAVKLRATADVTEGGTLGVAVVYANNPSEAWSAAEWSVAASYSQKMSDTLALSVGAQYFANTDFAVAGSPSAYAIGANVDWTPVTNFLVRAQVQYKDATGPNNDSWNARLRFQRSF